MNQQLTLYDYQILGAPSNGTETSAMAAQEIAPHLSRLEGQVLECLRRHGPSTQERISILTGLALATVNPRVNKLAKGWWEVKKWVPPQIVAAAKHGYTRSGRKAVVWLLAADPPLARVIRPT